MKKFVLYRDYKAGSPVSYDYTVIKASSLKDLMSMVANMVDDTVYLASLYEKSDRPQEKENGFTITYFEEVLRKRSNGWYTPDETESRHTAKVYSKRGMEDWAEIG